MSFYSINRAFIIITSSYSTNIHDIYTWLTSIIMGGSVAIWVTEHEKINNLHTKADKWVKPYMGEKLTLLKKIGVNLPLCGVCKVWVSMSYNFR